MFLFAGVYCTEEGHETDVRDEVHEQAPVYRERRSEECSERSRDTHEARASFSCKSLVFFSR